MSIIFKTQHAPKFKNYLTLFLILMLSLSCTERSEIPADLILTNGEVYTMEEDQPWASSIVITDNKITAVLNEDESIDFWKGDHTRVVDLNGKFVVPGFIDGHVHFRGAGGFINGANLLKVS